MAPTSKAAWRKFKQGLYFGTGPSRKSEKTAARATMSAVVQEVRALIWATRPSCQACSGRRRAECGGRPDEMHEDPPRSKTRGLPPHERFNLKVCARLCHICHRDVTERRLRLEVDPSLGFAGKVVVHGRNHGDVH